MTVRIPVYLGNKEKLFSPMGKWRPIWTCEPVQANLGIAAPPGVCRAKRMMGIHNRKEQNEVADDQEM